jgi:hypothetical protein
MMAWPPLLAAAAAPSPADLVREAFRQDHPTGSIGAWWMLILAGALVALFIAMRALRWARERRLRSRPMRVFHHLAGELGLRLADQWLLVRIARQQALPSPLTLILSSSTLRHHGERFALTLKPRRQAQVMLHVTGIDGTLFGEG